MARKKTLHDDDGTILYPNTITDCVYNPDGTTLTDTLGNVDISNIGDGTITGAIVAVNQKRNKLFQYVSDGKYLVANAITDKGIDTPVDAEFATMRDNIRKLRFRHTNTWTPDTPVPFEFEQGCTVEYRDKIFLLGGLGRPNKVFTYNGEEWIQIVTSIPYNFYGGCAVVYNDEIHILGGNAGGQTKHYKLTLPKYTWTEVSTLPCNLCYDNAVIYNGEIHILGNTSDGTTHYKWDGTEWTSVSTIPYNFHWGKAVVYNDEIHILGGYTPDESNITRHYKWDGTEWTSVSTIPYMNATQGVLLYNGRIHTIITSGSNHTSHYIFDGEWHGIGMIPYEFSHGGFITYKDEIRLIGGENDNNNASSNYFYYEDPTDDNLPKLQTKFIRLSNSVREATVVPDGDYDAFSQVTTSVLSQTKSVDVETLLNNETVEVTPDDDSVLVSVNVIGPELVSPTITRLSTSNTEVTIPVGYHNGNGSVIIDCYNKTVNVNYGTAEVIADNDKAMIGVSIVGPVNVGEYTNTLNINKPSVTIPEGYHNGNGVIDIIPETKELSLMSGSVTVTPDGDKVLSSVIVNGPNKASSNQLGKNIVTNDTTIYVSIPTAGYYTTSDTITTGISEFGNNALTIDNVSYKNELKLASSLCNDKGIYSNTETFVDLPYSMDNGAAVVYRNHIHILGGGTQHYKLADDGLWEMCEPIPYEFTSGGAIVYNDEIHILGSDTYKYGDNLYTRHYKYNGTTWTRLGDLPYDFAYGGIVVFDGKIHIIGTGLGSGTDLNHYAWNGSSWSKISTLPIHFYAGSATVYKNEIHILGGSGSRTSHYKYIPSTNQWESVSTIPYEFTHGVAITFNNEIHILGSYASNSDSDGETWERNHYKWNGVMWTKVSTLPKDFCDNPALVLNDAIYVFGYANYDTMKGRCIIHFDSILQKLLSSSVPSVNGNTKLFVSV